MLYISFVHLFMHALQDKAKKKKSCVALSTQPISKNKIKKKK